MKVRAAVSSLLSELHGWAHDDSISKTVEIFISRVSVMYLDAFDLVVITFDGTDYSILPAKETRNNQTNELCRLKIHYKRRWKKYCSEVMRKLTVLLPYLYMRAWATFLNLRKIFLLGPGGRSNALLHRHVIQTQGGDQTSQHGGFAVPAQFDHKLQVSSSRCWTERCGLIRFRRSLYSNSNPFCINCGKTLTEELGRKRSMGHATIGHAPANWE